MIAATQTEPPRSTVAIRRIFRLGLAIVVTVGWAWVLNRSVTSANLSATPAGFARGALHGALMPGAMPMLFLGKDVVIYAQNNTGRTYKLGYTFGVNACGALFFGGFYWRLMRWRKRNSSAAVVEESTACVAQSR